MLLADDEPNAFAGMLAGLIEANLARHPRRASLLRPATVELEATDAGVAVAVRTRRGEVRIANGPANPGFDVRIRAGGQDLLALAAAPLLLGYPNPLRRDGRAVLGGLARGRIRVHGLLRHPVVLSRFARLLSVT